MTRPFRSLLAAASGLAALVVLLPAQAEAGHRHAHHGTVVDAPFTHVAARRHVVRVDAPFTVVERTSGHVHVRAPFVNIWVPR